MSISGRCECGACSFTVQDASAIWGVFICHCSMCPEKTYVDQNCGPGMPFAAIRLDALTYTNASNIIAKRTSSFATRSQCKICTESMALQYDCEKYTTWLCIDRLHAPMKSYLRPMTLVAHIHCGKSIDGNSSAVGDDGYRAFSGWEPWIPDPCRPKTVPEPRVCQTCFQLHDEQNDRKCNEERCTYLDFTGAKDIFHQFMSAR